MLRKIVILCITLICCLSTTCFAEGITVDYDIDTGLSDVSVSLPDDCLGKRIMLYVLKSDTSLNNLPTGTAQQQTDLLAAVDYAICDNVNSELFSDIKINGDNGEYIFNITVEGTEHHYSSSDTLYIPSTENVNTLKSSLQNASKETVLTTLNNEEENSNVGIDMNLYKLLSDSGKEYVANKMSNQTYSNIASIETAVITNSIASCMETPSEELLDKVLYPEKYVEMQEYISIAQSLNDMSTNSSLSTYTKLAALSDNDRKKLLSEVTKNGYSGKEELKNVISLNFILPEIKECLGYGDITTILNKYDDVLLSIDFDKYNGNNYLNSLNKDLLSACKNNQITTIAKLEEFVNEYKPTTSGGSGGGSSSSSSSSKGSGSIPITVSSVTNNLSNDQGVSSSFKDMSNHFWVVDAVEYLVDEGVINGKEDGVFAPQDNITREEFVKMIVCAFKMNLQTEYKIIEFEDIVKGSWYERYVKIAVSNGIINGISEKMFGVGENITRQDVAVIIHRVSNTPQSAPAEAFKDEYLISDYAKDGVSFVKNNKYMTGYEDGNFRPLSYITRAEAAKVIFEACR